MTTTMERTYRAPEVCRLVGITYRQLDYWIRSGAITTTNFPFPGSGDWRLFTDDDVAELRLIADLRSLGFSLQAIRRNGPSALRAKALRVLK